MTQAQGRITQIQGSVVDVEFSAEDIPDNFEALEIPIDGSLPMVLEVEKHMGDNVVRCVSMGTTDGLQRGIKVYTTGAPIQVPVGEATLGRVFNVLGRPVDGKEDVQADIYYPIHRPAPSFEQQSTRVEVFETGVKVIDLIAPFTKGGKTGIFGGAGVGKTIIIMELIRSVA
jgi:F-type H+-transporting ATPase subunit beta